VATGRDLGETKSSIGSDGGRWQFCVRKKVADPQYGFSNLITAFFSPRDSDRLLIGSRFTFQNPMVLQGLPEGVPPDHPLFPFVTYCKASQLLPTFVGQTVVNSGPWPAVNALGEVTICIEVERPSSVPMESLLNHVERIEEALKLLHKACPFPT
jgi:hypothetical protein